MQREYKYVLPLICQSFEAGGAFEFINGLEDGIEKKLMTAEYHYFCGHAEACHELTEAYIKSPKIEQKLTANLLYGFSSLTLGNIAEAKQSIENIQGCLTKVLSENENEETKAVCVFSAYLSTVLLHIPPAGLPDLSAYSKHLPMGLRLYAVYILAHEAYLKKDYSRALGMAQTAILLAEKCYPIPMIYLKCMISMCYINLKKSEQAKESFNEEWTLAKKDGFIEPFIEHHGLFQGMMESHIRKNEPELYKQITKGVLNFSRGWIKVHNPSTKKNITELLTPMEYSIAMLACRDWSNQEIAEYMDLSVNTVKHYLTGIFDKLHISKREQIKAFVNQ